MKILICFGTRPEWLKIKPIIEKLNKDNFDIFFTGQHDDLIQDVKADYSVRITNDKNRLDTIITSCILQFPNKEYDYVLVQGDTASAFGCSLAAYNRKIKIIHLEAGLRTYDLNNPYPEESYRQMISRISDINLCPTKLSRKNLKNEKINGKNYVVGNTVLDNLIGSKSDIKYDNIVLITLHRRENHKIISKWFEELNRISEKHKDIQFILPIHPNPEIQKYKKVLNNTIKVIDPLPHDELIKILKSCKFVITDSGGIQEESSFFNKKIIVCRKTTERPEGIKTGHIIMCTKPKKLEKIVEKVNNNFSINERCPYGDGKSSNKIIKLINNDNSDIKRL